MPTETPNVGAQMWDAAQATPWTPHNQALRVFDAFAQYAAIEDRNLAAPPGSCNDGARYLVDHSATGLWAGHEGEMAIALGANAINGWTFATVETVGTELWVRDEGIKIRWENSEWVDATRSGLPFILVVAASDESTELVAGGPKISFEWPADVILSDVFAFVTGAGGMSGNPIQIDVNVSSVSIFSTQPTIDVDENSSRNAVVPAVIDPSSKRIAQGAVVSIDIDDPGAGAFGLKVTFIGVYDESGVSS